MNVYELIGGTYVLLDTGILTLGIAKLLGLSLAWHLLLRALPVSGLSRRLTGAGLAVLLLPAALWSLQADLRGGWLVLGHHFLATRDEPKALAAYSKAWEAGDRRPVLFRQLMNLTCRRDRIEEALTLASEALRLFPNEQGLLLSAAEVRLFARDFSGAIAAAKQATVQDADLASMMRAYLVWAKALVHAGRPAEAIVVLREQQGRLPSPEARELLEREIRSLQADLATPASHAPISVGGGQ